MVNHLHYDYITASMKYGINAHAQAQMKDLGINYSHSTPQSMGDCFWFWNCEYEGELPSYLTVLDLDPHECIRFGLNDIMAKEIAEYSSK